MTIHRKEAGLTLLELLSVLVIISILMMSAGAAWNPLVDRVQASAVQTNIHRAFSLARSSAVHFGSTVTICPLSDENRCVNDWNRPVGIFQDNNNLYRVPKDAPMIKILTLNVGGFLRSSNAGRGMRRYFQFNPDGSSRGSLGHLLWCPASLKSERANHVRINFGGRLIWSRDNDGDGIIEGADGKNISC